MSRRRWILLKRYENRWPVWRYEPLQRHDLNARLRDGWKEVRVK
nr:MAG TPA: hypothetical protein [Caudoviricetes sp.]